MKRLHVDVAVDDLAQSTRFYSTRPTKAASPRETDSPLEQTRFGPPVPPRESSRDFRRGEGAGGYQRGLERRRLFPGGTSGSNLVSSSGESARTMLP
jgi:hypothetical protein